MGWGAELFQVLPSTCQTWGCRAKVPRGWAVRGQGARAGRPPAGAPEVPCVTGMGGLRQPLGVTAWNFLSRCQGQASGAPPPAWPELPSLGEHGHSLEAGGGAAPGNRGDFLSWGGLLSTASVFPRAPLVERRGVVGSQVAVPHPGGPLPLQAPLTP